MVRQLLLLLAVVFSFLSFAQLPEIKTSPSQRVFSEIDAPVFRKNNGQWDQEILYRMTSGQSSIAFYKNKIQFGLRKASGKPDKNTKHPQLSFLVWDMVFENPDIDISLLASGKIDSKLNFFKGNSGLSTVIEEFGKLTYRNIYRNIDLVFYLDKNDMLKYDFIVKPGADISDIKLSYIGVKKIKKDNQGNLIITTPWGNKLKEGKPVSWQMIGGKKVFADIAYSVNGKTLSYQAKSALSGNAVLTIDPMMLDWSTYFYGKVGTTGWGYTYVMDMDIDKDNNVYVTGFTNEKFPMRVGTYDTIPNSTSWWDGFVAKVSVNGDSLLSFTYIGGSSWSYILSISVNSQEQPVISGFTYAKDYPVTSNAYDKSAGTSTGYRGFITKFSSDFKTLVFSTYFGKSNTWGTVIQSMALTANGDVVFTGQTNATDFPVTTGCYQSTYAGGANDAFLTRLSADGSKLIYSTFFGGTGDDKATDLSLNASEDVYIVGSTANSNFPLTAGAQGPFKYTNSDVMDGFVARIQNDGKKMLWSKMMGGSGSDYFEGLYVNSNDELYIAGYSNSSNFYTTPKALQPNNAGGYDHVVVKMNKSGTNLYYSTFLGGGGDDNFYSGYWWTSNIRITANVKDEPIIGGVTKSKNYPITADALQKTNKATGFWSTNLAITKLSYDGSNILYCTYFGGSSWEWTTVLKVKKISCMSSILYGGITGSTDYPTTKGVFKEKSKPTTNSYSGFMSRFRDTLYTEPIEFKDDFIECDNVYEVLDAKNRGAAYLWNDGSKKQNLIITDTGTYWVRATYGCDTVRDTIRVRLEYSAQLNLPTDTTLCNNVNGIILDAENDTILRRYLWNTGDTTQTITVKKPGIYVATVTTPHCGFVSDTTSVKFLKVPDIINIQDSVFCDSIRWKLVTDSLGPGTKYLWSTGDTLLITKIAKVGNYQLKVQNYCGYDSVSFNTSLLYAPKADLPKDTTVCNQFILKYKIGTAQNEEWYNWYDPIQKIYFGTNDSISMNTPALLAVSIENRCGIAKDSVRIERKLTPVIDLGNDSTYCNNIYKLLTIGTSNNAETYLWKGGAKNNTFTITSPGRYWATIKNLCGQASDTVLFTQKNTLAIDLGNDTLFCDGVIKNLDISQPDPDAEYLWHDGTSLPTNTANTQGKIFATIKNFCGTISDTVNYSLIFKPILDLGKDEIFCDNFKPFNRTVGKVNNNEIYLWSDGNTSGSNTFDLPGKYWVDSKNNCGIASDTISISVIYSPKVNIGPDTALCGIFNLPLDAANSGLSFYWEPTRETTQTIIAKRQATYKVTVTDKYGCYGVDEMQIKDDCKSKWFISNAFSPNGDNINDEFIPTLINCEQYSIAIYNTWGEKIFYSENPFQSWDGTYLDKNVPLGNYVYVIHFKSSEDKSWYIIKDVVTVVR